MKRSQTGPSLLVVVDASAMLAPECLEYRALSAKTCCQQPSALLFSHQKEAFDDI